LGFFAGRSCDSVLTIFYEGISRRVRSAAAQGTSRVGAKIPKMKIPKMKIPRDGEQFTMAGMNLGN
jgi:hypothetical protein